MSFGPIKSRLMFGPSGLNNLGLSPFREFPRSTRPAASVGGSSDSLSRKDSISRRGWAVSFSATDDSSQESFRPAKHGIMVLAGAIGVLQM